MVTFYNDGLKFECTRCSYCCRYTPGYVFLSHNDLERITEAFNLEQSEFIERYCRFVDMNEKLKLSFIEKENYDCIFWEADGCSIYESRPIQCKSYPFWGSHLHSYKDWSDLSFSCPGIGKGKGHSQHDIETWLHAVEKEDYDFSRYKKVIRINGK